MTSVSLFSGFGGADIGLKAAGFTPVGAVEYKSELAEVYRANIGDHVSVADIREVDFMRMEKPDLVWASPVCTNASVANSQGGETELDRECARASMRAVATWLPRLVLLENVWGYRTFDSFAIILSELEQLGYSFNFWHLNAANYGVPQTRKRLILAAVREKGLRLTMPEPTHAKEPVMTLFGQMERWNGWYGAIEDLLPTLPESKFAPWQIERIRRLGPKHEMFLIPDDNTSNDTLLPIEAPSMTIRTEMVPKAFIACGMANKHGESVTIRHEEEPMFVVNAQTGNRQTTRAFLCSDQSASDGKGLSTREASAPSQTVCAKNGARGYVTIRASLETGRVVAMTPRALSRFQSFPDSFELPDKRKTACVGIGNAVPCLLAQRVAEHFRGWLN